MFLYYVENWQKYATPPDELAYAFADAAVKCRQVTGGPGDGGAGVLFTLNQRDKLDLDQQTWRRIPGGKAWCGHWNDERPTADSLLRPKALQGHTIELGDGCEWHVPIARTVDDNLSGAMLLPRKIVTNDEGEWIYGEVIERCRRLWQIAEIWWDHVCGGQIVGGEVSGVDPQAVHSMASEVLGFNYRVGPAELSMLGVWETGLAGQVLDLLCDVPKVLEVAAMRQAQAEKKSDDPVSA